jgi:ribosome-binding factor A
MKLFLPAASQSHRSKRVAQEIQKILSHVITDGCFPLDLEFKMTVPVTVTHVEMSNDLQHAQVFIMPLGGIEVEHHLKVVTHFIPFLRKELSKKLYLKFTPQLSIRLDKSFDRAETVLSKMIDA